MEPKYVAFDIEIAADIPEGAADWKQYRPLGITCAATLASDEAEPQTWSGGDRMTVGEVCALVDYLQDMESEGYRILTWNGLSFDFDILAEESGRHEECADLALGHIDMMFHVFCLRGHFLGLDKAAKGLGLPGKTEGVSGAMAPQMWADGRQAEVLEYVAQDVRTTLAVAQGVDQLGEVRWTSQRGKPNGIDIDRWLTAKEAQQLPLPDTSWMNAPVSRGKFTAWMEEA